MTVLTDKLDQAIFINKNGCSDLVCGYCKFINRYCRLYKPETDPDIKNTVTKYLRNEKLQKLKS